MNGLLGNQRALLAAAAPLTGLRATGLVQMYAATGTVQIPRGTYALPVFAMAAPTGVTGFVGALDPARAVKVAGGISGTYDVGTTGAGTGGVPFMSNIGGAQHNFPSGTRFIFDPAVAGLTGVMSTNGFGGGVSATGFGGLRSLITAESMGPPWYTDLRRAPTTFFPVAVLTWNDLVPADGSTVPTTQRGSRLGTGKTLYRAGYTLSVFSARMDNQPWRSQEAYQILWDLITLLSDKNSADHELLSNPSGVQIQRVVRESLTRDDFQRFYVYSIDLNCSLTVERTELRDYVPWLLSRVMLDRDMPYGAPGGDPRIVDMLVDMRPTLLTVDGEEIDGDDSDTDVVVE